MNLNNINLANPDEILEVLSRFNDTGASFPREKNIVDIFEDQAVKFPYRVAVSAGDELITYEELSARASRFATLLKQHVIEVETPVGLMMDNSVSMIVSILGILKSGAAYMPINPQDPFQRIKFMLEDAACVFLVSEKKYIKQINRLQWECNHLNYVMCADSVNFYAETEEENELMREDLWNYIGETADDDIAAGAWHSSYTGEKLARLDMNEYAENALNKILPYINNSTKILEIGCSSGISMFRISPHVKEYHGIDISPAILAETEKEVKRRGLSNISLTRMSAHEIGRLAGNGPYDIIIMNSVVQCFNGYNYFRKVMSLCMDLLPEKGVIFLGDLQDPEKKEEMISAIKAYETNGKEDVRKKTNWENELFVSKQFLQELPHLFQGINQVEHTAKVGTAENELTRFRYDSLLRIDKTETGGPDHPRRKFQLDAGHLGVLYAPPEKTTATPDSLAYIIFTSGSTGLPKGCMITHGNVVRLLKTDRIQFDFSEWDRWILAHAYTFDFSVWEIFGALLFGGCLVVPSRDEVRNMETFLDIISSRRITVLNQTPLAFKYLQELPGRPGLAAHLRYVIFGGDKLEPTHLKNWIKQYPPDKIRLINMYGITETTVHVTFYQLTEADLHRTTPIPAGAPIAETTVYILNEHGSLLPVGAIGEIYIGGTGVCRGYLNRPDLTASRFIDNPFYGGGKLYRSGDIGRWLDNGHIEVIGRKDTQVKIRGFRVELGEIEKQLKRQAEIKDCIVTLETMPHSGEKEMVAYIVLALHVDQDHIRTQLTAELPDHMIPSEFRTVDYIPLNINGKPDLNSLFALFMKKEKADEGRLNSYIEAELTGIWSEILHHEAVGRDDNFFRMGGHSLKATRLISLIQQKMNRKLDLKVIFEHPTIAKMATVLEGLEKSNYTAIQEAARQKYYPLSGGQYRLWVESRQEAAKIAYNIPLSFLLTGKLDLSALKSAFRTLISRHEILRTSFVEAGETVMQQVAEPDNEDFSVDFSDVSHQENWQQVADEMAFAASVTNFDLAKGKLLKVALIKVTAQQYVLLITLHHIIADGWSMDVMMKELRHLYRYYLSEAGTVLPLAPVKLQYRDYVLWEAQRIKEPEYEIQEKYWLNQLGGDLPLLDLPFSGRRPMVKTYQGNAVIIDWDQHLCENVKMLGHELQVSPFMIFLTSLNILLYKYTGQNDIIIGTPVAGREHNDLEEQIGFYINSLPLRSAVKGGDIVLSFIEQIKNITINGYKNQSYPYDKMIAKKGLKRDPSRSPLFDIMLVLQNTDNDDGQPGHMDNVLIEPYKNIQVSSIVDLRIDIQELSECFQVTFNYNSALMPESGILKMAEHFRQVVAELVKNTACTIDELSYISPGEEAALASQSACKTTTSPVCDTIHGLFEWQAAQRPDAVALQFENSSLTYRELNQRANQLAWSLKEQYQVKREELVGLLVDRSEVSVISMLGILKAGAAYLPLDPQYPADRIRFSLEDAAVRIVITEQEAYQSNAEGLVSLIYNDHTAQSSGQHRENLPDQIEAGNLAYVIYTSGSTGRPKGVMVEHGNVVRLFREDSEKFSFTNSDIWSLFHSICFDFSVWEIFGALSTGAKLMIWSREVVLDPILHLQMLKEQQVSVLNQIPSLFYNLATATQQVKPVGVNVRYVIFGGESLNPQMLAPWNQLWPETCFVNMYGITEIAVHATFKKVSQNDINTGISNIGKQLPTAGLYLMDAGGHLVPDGIPGEIMIAGSGVARGYLNLPELTASRFVRFPIVSGERMYRSGDMGKKTPENEVIYLGRKDQQIKINGYRVETGEIESILIRFAGCTGVVVTMVENTIGSKDLVAYYTAPEPLDTGRFRQFANRFLPAFMVPQHYCRLTSFPRTSSGKINIKLLPAVKGQSGHTTIPEKPSGYLEEGLAKIWANVLEVSTPGVLDNYFEYGGDSMKAIKLIARLNEYFSADLKVADLYERPTIKSLAQVIPMRKSQRFRQIIDNGIREIDRICAVVMEQEKQTVPDGHQEIYPMTPIETGMIYSSMLNPDEPVYYDQFTYRVKIKSAETLINVLQILTDRHPIFRSRYYMKSFHIPLKVVMSKIVLPVTMEDITAKPEEEQLEHIRSYLQQDLATRLTFEGELLWRVHMIKLSVDKFYLFWSFHHALLDGWSAAMFITELSRLMAGDESSLHLDHPLRSSYRDYCALILGNGNTDRAEKYWSALLDGYTMNRLPFNYKSYRRQGRTGTDIIDGQLSQALLQDIERLARSRKVSIKAVFVAAHLWLMHITSGESDIITGVVAHDRPPILDAEKIMGCFLHTFPLRVNLSDPYTPSELLAAVQTQLDSSGINALHLSAIARLTGDQSSTANLLFNCLLNYVDFHVMDNWKASAELDIDATQWPAAAEIRGAEMTNTFFDMEVSRTGGILRCRIKYHTAYFDRWEISYALELYERILTLFTAAPESIVRPADIMTVRERRELLYEFNDTNVDYPVSQGILHDFEKRVPAFPDRIALKYGDGHITYGSLNRQSERISGYLRANGVMPGTGVGLVCGRGPDLIIYMLGILKAGCYYIPVDPQLPPDRQIYMLKHAGAACVLADNHYDLVASEEEGIVSFLPNVHALPDSTYPPPIVNGDDVAYVIYTSGSTGRPKGVIVRHHAVVNLINWVNQTFSVNETDRLLFITSVSFDLSVYDVFGVLSAGGTVVIADEESIQGINSLATQLMMEKITFWDSVPSTLQFLVQHLTESSPAYSYTGLRLAFLSGDWIPVGLPRVISRFFPCAVQISLGGATEGTVWSNYYPIIGSEQEANLNSIPYGKPIFNNRFYILSSSREPVLKGVAGELYIGGVGVAEGYINAVELSSERFIADPFSRTGRLYRTGDMGRMLNDGNIEFLGRIDHQIKVRGYRVELGEIEHQLQKYAGIEAAVVVPEAEGQHNYRLHAYVISNARELTEKTLNGYLAGVLPSYMVPSAIHFLNKLPLTSNGKIDRKLLQSIGTRQKTETTYEAPRSDHEKTIAALWENLLGSGPVGIHHNILALGAHSLNIGVFVNRLFKETGIEISLRDVFLYPTIARLGSLVAGKSAVFREEIAPVATAVSYPLSHAQQRLWIASNMDSTRTAYNITSAYRIEGRLNRTVLVQALHYVLNRHEALRTVFAAGEDGLPRQYIRPAREDYPVLSFVDLQHNTHSMAEAVETCKTMALYEADLSEGPLFKTTLLQISVNTHVLILYLHHIIADGWSMEVLYRDLLLAYSVFSKGHAFSQPALGVQYKDYAHWLENQISAGHMEGHRAYWLEQFRLPVNTLELPADYIRPTIRSNRGALSTAFIDLPLVNALKSLGQQEGASLFSVLLTLVKAILYRYTGQHDIVVGTPVAGREGMSLEMQIGFYVNNIALRTEVDGTGSFRKLLSCVKDNLQEGIRHQLYPFDLLVDELDARHDMSHTPLFDVMVVLQNTYIGYQDMEDQPAAELTVYPFAGGMGSQVSRYDVEFDFIEVEDGLQIHLVYNTDLFKEKRIHRLLEHFKQLAAVVITASDMPLDEVCYLSHEEKNTLLHKFNQSTPLKSNIGITLHSMIFQRCMENPDVVALTDGDTVYSYGMVNELSDRLAGILKACTGLTRGDLAGVLMDRSAPTLMAILGILRSGGAYVPIDPDFPMSRKKYIIQDASLKVLVTMSRPAAGQEEDYGCPVIYWDELLQRSTAELYKTTGMIGNGADLAYVIYTSGSTGMPKGVMINHEGAVNRISWMWQQYGFGSGDIILQKTSAVFDVSVWELFMPLCFGAREVFCSREEVYDLQLLQQKIQQERVTTIHFVPTMLSQFLQLANPMQLGSLRHVFCSGEALKQSHVEQFYRILQVPLYNLYGPTEASVDVSYYDTRPDDKKIPIGHPISNIQLYILNNNMQIVPIGIPGQIAIGGVGLARGYLNCPELSHAHFVPHPFHEGERIYLTGDTGYWQEDGNIIYVGRNNNQVKIRGYRIELEEIEHVLLQNHLVNAAAVTVVENEPGSRQLAAYVTGEYALDMENLRTYLESVLPGYMIPARLIKLDVMPLNASGKADRGSLPIPDFTGADAGPEYVAPRTLLEKKTAEIFSETLKTKVGIYDNYFSMGGDSIKSIKLITRLNNELGLPVSVNELLRFSSVAKLLQHAGSAATDRPEEALVRGHDEIRAFGARISARYKAHLPAGYEDIYPITPIEAGMIYSSLIRDKEPVYYDQFIFSVKIQDQEKFLDAFSVMITRHANLRSRYYLKQFDQMAKVVCKTVEMPIHFEDISMLMPDEQEERIKAYLADDLSVRLSFEGDLLWRMRIFTLKKHECYLVWSFHHALMDGWSAQVFAAEISALLSGGAENKTMQTFPPLKYSYKDYCAILLGKKKLIDDKEFWKRLLNGYERNKLPFNHSGKPRSNTDGVKIIASYPDKKILENARKLAQKNRVSIKSVFLATYIYLLHIICREDEIVTGVVIHNRPEIEHAERIMGCFLNTVPFRINVKETRKVSSFVKQVDTMLRDVNIHQLHLSEVIELIGERTPVGNPVFDCLFDYTDFHIAGDWQSNDILAPLAMNAYNIRGNEMTNTLFDLELDATLGDLAVQIKYAPAYFFGEDMEYALTLYEKILSFFVAQHDQDLDNISLLCENESRELLYQFNDTLVPWKENDTLHSLMEQTASTSENWIALRFGNHDMTYGELNRLSGKFARYLQDMGVATGDNVGLLTGRGFDMIVGMYGILKAGAAYVPIDPAYPADRQRYIAQNSGIKTIVTTADLKESGTFGGDFHFLVIDKKHLETFDDRHALANVSAKDLAYIIHTSGSTGMPKGVMIEHHAAVNLVNWVNKTFSIGKEDRVLFVNSMCFDLSVYDIFGMLAVGGTVVIAAEEDVYYPSRLKTMLRNYRITMWDTVPTLMNYLLREYEEQTGQHQQQDLKWILLSGDWIPQDMYEKLKTYFPKAQMIGLGGATEATVWSNYFLVDNTCETWHSIPYGKPIDNNFFYILDDDRKLVPRGVAGELYIGGSGVARGYINNISKTEAAFFKDPFRSERGGRMYKTGDIGRMLPDGNIELIGRKDFQVKIRGYRIELGEIEHQLLRYSTITEAVVEARKDSSGEGYLCAFIVANEAPDMELVRDFLSLSLPYYMIPSYILQVAKMPLTGSGKIDRKMLPPTPVIGKSEKLKDTSPVVGRNAATTTAEERMCAIWREVLGVEQIGIHDDFFMTGGNSIRAIQASHRLSREFGSEISVAHIFLHKTVARLLQFCLGLTEITIPRVPGTTAPLSFAQERLWFMEEFGEGTNAYHIPAIFELEERADLQGVKYALQQVIQRHEVLSSVIHLDSSQRAYQEVMKHSLETTTVDLPVAAEYEKLLSEAMNQPFDLRNSYPLRVTFYNITGAHPSGADRVIVLVNLHHIAGDGWSMGVFQRELYAYYNAYIRGDHAFRLPPLPIQYKDYARWQRGYLTGTVLADQLHYWKQKLSGYEMLNLPTDFVRPQEINYQGSSHFFTIGAAASIRLRTLAKEYGVTLHSMLLGCFSILLGKYSYQDDIITGSPIANRQYRQTEGLIGFFVNMQVNRVLLDAAGSYEELVQQIHRDQIAAQRYQDLPFEKLVEELEIERDSSRHPVFQIMFAVQHFGVPEEEEQSCFKAYSGNAPYNVEKFDMSLFIDDSENILSGQLSYATSLFSESTIIRFSEHYVKLAEQLSTIY